MHRANGRPESSKIVVRLAAGVLRGDLRLGGAGPDVGQGLKQTDWCAESAVRLRPGNRSSHC
jgi:hypothetical protein